MQASITKTDFSFFEMTEKKIAGKSAGRNYKFYTSSRLSDKNKKLSACKPDPVSR